MIKQFSDKSFLTDADSNQNHDVSTERRTQQMTLGRQCLILSKIRENKMITSYTCNSTLVIAKI